MNEISCLAVGIRESNLHCDQEEKKREKKGREDRCKIVIRWNVRRSLSLSFSLSLSHSGILDSFKRGKSIARNRCIRPVSPSASVVERILEEYFIPRPAGRGEGKRGAERIKSELFMRNPKCDIKRPPLSQLRYIAA